ncbi:hypothetical protein [Rubrimonas cliftonensis]|nr:hypothetical protein [Rubrimonas cliftonensis]
MRRRAAVAGMTGRARFLAEAPRLSPRCDDHRACKARNGGATPGDWRGDAATRAACGQSVARSAAPTAFAGRVAGAPAVDAPPAVAAAADHAITSRGAARHAGAA